MGKLYYKYAKYRVLIIRTNISLCFPKKSKKEQEEIVFMHCISMGIGIIEAAMSWFLPMNKLLSLLDDEIGISNVESALKTKRPILILGMHTTGLDLGSPFMAKALPIFGMYRPSKNPVFEYIIQKGRLRHFKFMFPQSELAKMVKNLKGGHNFWYATDQDFGSRAKGVFVPFFGVNTYTIAFYAKLAKKTDAIIIPAAAFRDKNGTYKAYYSTPMDISNINCDIEAAALMNKAIENLITPYIDQYYWSHRRFKTRPMGEDDLYPKKPSHVRREKRQKKRRA